MCLLLAIGVFMVIFRGLGMVVASKEVQDLEHVHASHNIYANLRGNKHAEPQPAFGNSHRILIGLPFDYFVLRFVVELMFNMYMAEVADINQPADHLRGSDCDIEHCLGDVWVTCQGCDAGRDKSSSDGRIVGNSLESFRLQELGILGERLQTVDND